MRDPAWLKVIDCNFAILNLCSCTRNILQQNICDKIRFFSRRLFLCPTLRFCCINCLNVKVNRSWINKPTRMRLFINAPCLCLDYWWLILGFISMSREEIKPHFHSCHMGFKCNPLNMPQTQTQPLRSPPTNPLHVLLAWRVCVVGRFPLDVGGFRLGDLYVFSCQKTLGRRKGGWRNL